MSKRIIFHIDVNSAFLSWSAVHALQHGATIDFREIPSIVGGNQETRHGIVLAKSIPAKKFKIQTGEPVIQAKRKCPNLVIVPPDYLLYMQCSSAMLEILREYSDRIQIFSIDECFLDYTGMEKILGDPIQTAYIIKERIRSELGYSVNIGISSNKLLAKMGGDLVKPNKVITCFPEEMQTKLWPLPVEDLYMCGRQTAPKLHSMGIYTIGDLANSDLQQLQYKLKSWGIMLWQYANGIEDSEVTPGGSIPYIKGIGNGTTIHFDVEDRETAYKVLLSLTEMVAMRLRHGGFCCRLVSVSMRTNELLSYSHQKKLYVPTDCTNQIYHEACRLFDKAWKGQPIRHLGVRVSDLCTNEFVQLSLLENNFEKQRKIDRTIDNLRIKFGTKSVFRSTFLHSRLSPITGGITEENNFVMSSIL
ncbi:MAG: DNA polymerase IV [Clostridia bacterium]|nr:DNA polymerase IV [Clostridia bacterium]